MVSVDADHGTGADNGAAGPDIMEVLDSTSPPSPSNSAPCIEDDTVPSDEDYSYGNDNSMRFPDDLPCDCGPPTLATLEGMLGMWRRLPLEKPWIQWHSQYEDKLKHAWQTSDKAFNEFYKDTFAHVTERNNILEAIQDVIQTPCPRCREGLKYDIP